MNLKDIVSQLANRINQPHVIEVYLRQVYAKGFVDGTKQSPWISVEERKPKDGERVWVKSNRFNNLPLFYITGRFRTSLKGGYYDDSVTHWMPIPQ